MTLAAITNVAAPANTLGLQDVMKILLTQLTYQDPLKPMDNQAFMAQMAQFTSLEQSQQLNERMQQLIENQAALQSIGLIGRSVEITTEAGKVTGTVASLSLQGDAPVLTVTSSGGAVIENVSLGQIVSVH